MTVSRWTARLVWGIARAVVWVYYRLERAGGDVPDGPALLVANHANGILDPAVVVATARRAPRFLAKSTLFRMPLVGWFVRGAGSVPVYRREDAASDVARNLEMFEAVQEALTEGEAVCLFPEGRSHSSGRLEPLKTGAARIALAAAADGVPVRLVPIGLNFQEKAEFRSTVLVAYGAAFTCEHLVELYRARPGAAVHALTDEIATRLRDVVVEAEPTRDVDLVVRVEQLYAEARRLPKTAEARLERRRRIASGLAALRGRDPGRFANLYEQLRRYERRRARFGLLEGGYLQEVPPRVAARFALRELALGLVLVPVALAGAVVFFVPYQLVRLAVPERRDLLDQVAIWKIGSGAVAHLAWVGALAYGAHRWLGTPAEWAALIGLPVLALSAVLAMEREGAVADVVRGYLASRFTRDTTESRLIRRRAAIADLLDETWRWLQTPSDGEEREGERPEP